MTLTNSPSLAMRSHNEDVPDDLDPAARPKRRSFSAEQKLSILSAYEPASEPGAKGALLRREGIYSSHITEWRKARDAGSKSALGGPAKHPKAQQAEMGIVAVPESPAYCASKGAVIMLTKSITVDLIQHNIRVNSLCPGITRTSLLQAEVDNSLEPARTAAEQAKWAPIMRVADPREIAQGALFLVSDDSSFAVGSCLVLDGGFTAK
jgi:NAD(P)-dependent dehydrogenase (short-subunit alcohol dehydrogenase family)